MTPVEQAARAAAAAAYGPDARIEVTRGARCGRIRVHNGARKMYAGSWWNENLRRTEEQAWHAIRSVAEGDMRAGIVA